MRMKKLYVCFSPVADIEITTRWDALLDYGRIDWQKTLKNSRSLPTLGTMLKVLSPPKLIHSPFDASIILWCGWHPMRGGQGGEL